MLNPTLVQKMGTPKNASDGTGGVPTQAGAHKKTISGKFLPGCTATYGVDGIGGSGASKAAGRSK